MSAVVTGGGLGLERNSGSTLGAAGQLGSSALGTVVNNVFVNAATGNLVVQASDQFLLGLGVDLDLSRTYNSLGSLSGNNGALWSDAYARKVLVSSLTGTVDTAGSTIQRLTADGDVVTYSYDSGRGAYVANEGGGAYDTLSFNGGTGMWTWTDGASQTTELYDANHGGRLVSVTDHTGLNTLNVSYDPTSGLISSVQTAGTVAGQREGVTVHYTTVAGQSEISDVEETTYDSAGGAHTSGYIQYTYDAQGRLTAETADVTPGDLNTSDGNAYTTYYGYSGSSDLLSSIFEIDGSELTFGYDGSSRVTSVSQVLASGVWTTTTIGYQSGSTTVAQGASPATTLNFDGLGQLTSESSPLGETAAFGYDAMGDVTSVTENGVLRHTYSYDVNGNQLSDTSVSGSSIVRSYSATNQLLTSTSYTGTGTTGTALTTDYIYDGQGDLVGVIDPTGAVTQYVYGAAPGEATSVIHYAADTTLPGLSSAALNTWAAGWSTRSGSERTDYAFDWRGAVATRYAYDGSDRLRYVVDAKGGVTSLSYDAAGHTTTRQYDAFANLVRLTDPNGHAGYFYYNALNQQVLSIDAMGYLIADANGLSSSNALVSGQSLTIPSKVTDVHNNASTFTVYDPSKAIGNVSPTTPPPPPPPQAQSSKDGGCGVFGEILEVVVAVAVGFASGGIGAAVGETLFDSAAAGTVGGAVAAATDAAIGSVAAQAFGVATGIQSEFSWSGVALAAISAGFASGVSSLPGVKALDSGIKGVFGAGLGGDIAAGVNGAIGSALTQSVAVATGLQSKFDWAGVAAIGVTAGVSEAVSGALGVSKATGLDKFIDEGVTGAAGAIAGASARSLITGSDFGQNLRTLLPQAIGQTIGQGIVDGIVAAQNAAPSYGQFLANHFAQDQVNGVDLGPGVDFAGPGAALPHKSLWGSITSAFSSAVHSLGDLFASEIDYVTSLGHSAAPPTVMGGAASDDITVTGTPWRNPFTLPGVLVEAFSRQLGPGVNHYITQPIQNFITAPIVNGSRAFSSFANNLVAHPVETIRDTSVNLVHAVEGFPSRADAFAQNLAVQAPQIAVAVPTKIERTTLSYTDQFLNDPESRKRPIGGGCGVSRAFGSIDARPWD